MKSDKQIAKDAAEFADRWQGEGYEKGQSQMFWSDLLTKVYGIEDLTSFVRFEEQVKSDTSTTNFIDVRIPSTKVFIEQKSINKDLRAPIKQSDGNFLTPFQQVKRYANDVGYSQRPRWIITCNFKEFLVYDMEQPNSEPESILLKDLGTDYYRLKFLVDEKSEHISKEMEVSMAAGEIVGRIYDALLKQYDDNSPEALRWLNILCVRIVFCLYAEDAGIFSRDQFHNYLAKFDTEGMRQALLQLFQTLNTKEGDRSKFLRDDLKAFPYTNGGLFAAEIEIPQFTDELRLVLLHNASLDFDWSKISPTIFGAVFESTLNPETRRAGGMHYTSIENIHKVIDALFLNTLRKEFETILEEKVEKTRNRLLDAFQDKLASLVFFDPACGSGNFLTETYLSLRRLENEVIRARYHGQAFIGFKDNSPIKVSISQFYGIEINDFAVTVATKIIEFNDDFLPLKTYTNITEGNALRVDWESVVPKDKLSYIIGNPPFVGVNYMSDGQREDMDNIWSETKRGKLDYVTCWYMKAAVMMIGTNIRTALVSTNSVTQGEQAAVMWKALFDKGIHIDFAHRTFIWDSEASLKAHVHCVIVGFSWAPFKEKKYIYTSGNGTEATTINGYLLDAPVVIIEERSKPLCDVPSIVRGSQATDDGHYLFTPEEKAEFLKKEPQAEKFFKRFMMGREFINNIERWCLWMPNITPTELKFCPEILKRVQAVKELREASKNKQTQQSANIPWRFGQYRVPAEHYIAFAKVSSERRRYVPFGFLTNEVIPGDKLFTIPDATIYMFGVLTSNVHMAWMRTVCGRLKSDYSYSTTIVYNNFPWPLPTEEQKAKIEQTASLADLYDEVAMPPELRKAHQANDRAVMEAYGWKVSREFTESVCVAELFKLYEKLTK